MEDAVSAAKGCTTGMSRDIGRRSVVKGAAWTVPVIMAASAAPAFAASTASGILTLQHDVPVGCVSSSGIADVYYYLNIRNNTGADYVLAEPLVITLNATNTRRSKLPASSSYGTVVNTNNNNTVTWTLPAGFVIPANSDVDLLWHFLTNWGQPTSVAVTTVSPLVTNPTSNSADGYGSGCTGEF